jgi:hypothetical protein
VTAVLPSSTFDPSEVTAGSPYFQEPLTFVLGTYTDDEFDSDSSANYNPFYELFISIKRPADPTTTHWITPPNFLTSPVRDFQFFTNLLVKIGGLPVIINPSSYST